MDPHLLLETLEKYWGYSSFRPLQEDIIRSVCSGKDTLGLMPTGGGKSITFQVPTLLMPGICIVITPLISLMKDQVDNLKERGIKATAVYSGMTREEIGTQLENCIFGNYKFLYISPERLNTALFRSKLSAMNVSLLVVDESHCISQWGYDFRPSYLHIAKIREILPEVSILALTATATPEAVDDIQEKLLFRRKNVFQTSFARQNLSYVVRHAENKQQSLIHMLKQVPGTAIVYVRNRKQTQEIASFLQQSGISAHFFHAGLERMIKTERQNQWKDGSCRVMVATNAFGMGIDKPDVRLVIHMDMPGSLEEYFQEAGRAGRDGQRAFAVALCASAENAKLKKHLSDEFPGKEFIIHVYDTLGSYLQIASGFGLFTTHDFSISDFCARHKFSLQQTHYALKLLELAGYIEYTEEPDHASRMMFLVNRENLYQTLSKDNLTDEIIQVILRSYTGMFADYAWIDETLIASRAHTTRQEVYQRLISLSKQRIIRYVPRKNVPQITYTRPREEPPYVVIPRSVYEERKERSQVRVNKVLEYINEKHQCRTRILLRYLGEQQGKECKTCDICLTKTSSSLKQWEFTSARNALIEFIAEKPQSLHFLAESLPLDPEKNIQAIRFLLDNDKQFQLKDEQVSFHKTK